MQYYSQGELSFIHTRYQFSTIITCTCTIPTPNVRHNVTVSDLTPHWFTNMGFTVLHWSPLSTLLCFSSTANTPANAPHDIHTKNGVKHTPCNNIPQFFFPHGKPLPVVEQERKLRKVVVSENRWFIVYRTTSLFGLHLDHCKSSLCSATLYTWIPICIHHSSMWSSPIYEHCSFSSYWFFTSTARTYLLWSLCKVVSYLLQSRRNSSL